MEIKIQPTGEISPVRAKSFKIISAPPNFAQYVRTVKAYALAGMPLEHIANAGDHLGDLVERKEIDTGLLSTSPSKAGEIAEDENQIMAWQNRGERISIVNQLSSAQPIKENNLVLSNPNQKQTVNVLEGIAVFGNLPQQLSSSGNNSQLENNPYLKIPDDLKKAA